MGMRLRLGLDLVRSERSRAQGEVEREFAGILWVGIEELGGVRH